MPEKPDFPKPNFDKIADKIIEEEHPSPLPQKSEEVLAVPVPEKKDDVEYDHQVFVGEKIRVAEVIRGKNGSVAYFCHEGVGRDYQEDRIVVNTEANGFASIDGMGGMGQGNKAAQILSEEIQHAFIEGRTIQEAQKLAHEKMEDAKVGHGGACYAAWKIEGKSLNVYSAGDVQVIVIRSGKVVFESEISRGIRKNIVTNAVTGNDAGDTLVGKFELMVGDRVVSASDGFWDNFDAQQAAVNLQGRDIHNAIDSALLATDRAMSQGGKRDNVNVIIYDIERLGEPEPYEEPKETQTRVDIKVPKVEQQAEAKAEISKELLEMYEKILDNQFKIFSFYGIDATPESLQRYIKDPQELGEDSLVAAGLDKKDFSQGESVSTALEFLDQFLKMGYVPELPKPTVNLLDEKGMAMYQLVRVLEDFAQADQRVRKYDYSRDMAQRILEDLAEAKKTAAAEKPQSVDKETTPSVLEDQSLPEQITIEQQVEKFEKHPIVEAAKEAGYQDFVEQYKALGVTDVQKIDKAWELHWDMFKEVLIKQLLEEKILS